MSAAVTTTNGDGQHVDNGAAGSVVFLCVDLGLAAEMRKMAFRAFCNIREMEQLRGGLEQRSVIVAYCGKDGFTGADLAAEWVKDHCYPERVGTLDMVEAMRFDGEPGQFGQWFDDATGMGRYEDGARFISLADIRTKWKRNPPLAHWASPVEMPAAGKGGANHQAVASAPPDYAPFSDEAMGIIRADSVEVRPIDWLWPYRLAAGEMALLAGDGGLGKSSLLLAIAALITTGGAWPDGSGFAPQGGVGIVSAEDSRETTLVPRLKALGADLEFVRFETARLTITREGQPPMVHPKYLEDCDFWREVIKRIPACKMLIVEPLPSYLGRGVNDSKNNELREILEPFIETVIRPRSVCFVANGHLNKNVDARTPMHRVMGSVAYWNLPRNVHLAFPDPKNADRMFFHQKKCNNAPRDLPTIAYRLVKKMIPSPAGEVEVSYPVFEKETVKDVDAQAALNPGRAESKRGPKPEKGVKFTDWLFGALELGAVPTSKLISLARDKGLLREPTDEEPEPSVSSLYDARARLPLRHPGWEVVDTTVEVPIGLSMGGQTATRAVKAWELKKT